MLMQDLGFGPPDPAEEARIVARHARGELGRAVTPDSAPRVPAAVLNADPLISLSGIAPGSPLGLASLAPAPLRARPAWFLLSPTWSIEDDAIAEQLRGLAVLHRQRSSHHRLIFVCNTTSELRIMRAHNEAAFFFNKTAHTLERIFRPLDDVRVDYDAIYNAQLIPWKRHELSLAIERCAFLFYRDRMAEDAASAQATIMARHAAAAPGHVFLNPLDDQGAPVRLLLPDVNRHLNRARVGLCLSEREGAMFANTEYLLSGLPIVTTPSTGGRDAYHDAEYCWTVPPDPRSVAEAVHALAARAVPRAHIHRRTVRRLEVDRARFLALINAILEEGGSERRLAMPWPFRKAATMQWLSSTEAVERAVHGVVDAFDTGKRSVFEWRRWHQAFRRLRRQHWDGPAE